MSERLTFGIIATLLFLIIFVESIVFMFVGLELLRPIPHESIVLLLTIPSALFSGWMGFKFLIDVIWEINNPL